ncbi:MAG: putative rane protein [Herbinix sp.]|nr:putative rane protein [Herbinix sp.]
MIETVYSNENGGDNRTNRVPALFKMPKNIRQVGKGSTTKKIYVEDYVMTFVKQLGGEDYSKCKVSVLLGQYVKIENCRNLFIYGAMEVENVDTNKDIIFTNDAWTSIYENIKKYFVDAEIVGWCLSGPGYLLEEEDKILKTHIDNFAGQDKTLLTYDSMEKEEAFLLYENNKLCKQEGYYIYYEKNEEMQTYMVEHKQTQSEEATYDDRVSKEIRTVIQNKKPTEEGKSVSRLMYAAGTLMAVIVLVVGAAMLNNYEQMRNIKDTLDNVSETLQSAGYFIADVTPEPTGPLVPGEELAEDGNVNVEVVPGNVIPLDDADAADETDDDTVKEDTAKEDTSEEDVSNEDNSTEEASKDNEDKPNETADTKDQADDKETADTKDNQDAKDQSAEEPESQETQSEVRYYTVVAGDTLVGICYKLYNSANYFSKIKELNGIEDENMIFVGQKLIVP